MNVYIAGPWAKRAKAQEFAELLSDEGHDIAREWWLEENEGEMDDHERMAQLADDDLEGVYAADALIVLNLEKSEGKAVEMGIALANCTPVCVVGKPTNIFHHLQQVTIVNTQKQAVKWLQELPQ